MKLEMYYPDDLHDIRVTRDLSLVLKASELKSWQANGRVRDHKCFVDFVIFDELPEDYQFSIKVSASYDASDLQDFAFNIGKLEINKWKQHEFNK